MAGQNPATPTQRPPPCRPPHPPHPPHPQHPPLPRRLLLTPPPAPPPPALPPPPPPPQGPRAASTPATCCCSRAAPSARCAWSTRPSARSTPTGPTPSSTPRPIRRQHQDIEYMVSAGGALDPSRYFIIIANLFGNGLSSSPSNTPWPDVGSRYPDVTCFDAVQVQRRMLQQLWGIERLALVYGWSMGAMQAYHWAALFPQAVERIAVVCGAARCAPHNQVFIEGVKTRADGRPGLPRRRLHRAAGARLSRHGPHLCRLGLVADLLPPGAVAQPGRQLAGRLPGDGLGGATSPAAIRPTCWPSSGPGSTATSAPMRCMAATCRARWPPSRPRCC